SRPVPLSAPPRPGRAVPQAEPPLAGIAAAPQPQPDQDDLADDFEEREELRQLLLNGAPKLPATRGLTMPKRTNSGHLTTA
ncbi:MAG: hypothetical protein KAX19_10285, partial [Candidatus Brocadiae bacterium]|nr:hypothetical protein [Candidatus Brocadiia bacterium]